MKKSFGESVVIRKIPPNGAELHQTFAKTKYKLVYHGQIGAWLKNHIVPVVVMNLVTVIHERQMKKIAGDDKLLLQMIAAMDEGSQVLEALGYPLTTAQQALFIHKRPTLMRLFMKIYHLLPMSRLVDGSVGEIVALSSVFHHWKEQTSVLTPNWDQLENLFNAKLSSSVG
ncbi:hypothetical protein [Paenibacillus brasilensis]|uniref:Transposase n=1 Tax=Paenibacillus brasilensis TaxID=128574 RepID=A0ABU0KSE8_9BACL|nr:hypothetical protein [Paenibacillus brasilensis]MDQ0492349.1 hypothetical protein [Paenibacillus brasilensis]